MLASLYAEPRLEPIFRIVDWAYATPTSLHVRNPSGGSTVLSSENGTRQGDPFGMLLFCLGIKAAIAAGLEAGGSNVKAVAVADDVNFVGPADGRAATRATAAFIQACQPLELSFRGDKSALLNFLEATLHQETLDFAHEHWIPTKRTITILGAPMGSDAEAVQALAVAELTGSERLLDSLLHPEMPLAVADNFLRVAAVPKLNYLCRVGTPGEYSRALAQFDARGQLTQSGMWRTQAPATSHERAPTTPLRDGHPQGGRHCALCVLGRNSKRLIRTAACIPGRKPTNALHGSITQCPHVHSTANTSGRTRSDGAPLDGYAPGDPHLLWNPSKQTPAELLQRRMLRGALDKADAANLRAAPPLAAARMMATRAK